METKRGTRFWQRIRMLLAAIGIAVIVMWLVTPAWTRLKNPPVPQPPQPTTAEAVRIEPGGAIVVAADSPLRERLVHVPVAAERVRLSDPCTSAVRFSPRSGREQKNSKIVGNSAAAKLRASTPIG